MKKILVIGSAVVDVIITLDHLPARSEDVHVITQEMRIGGCGYNVYDMIRHFNVPSIPFFPVGTGAYGNFVREHFIASGMGSPILNPSSDNGCCYCFVEADGERTFISYHGAEYRFCPEWFELPDMNEIDTVYICGLEIEEPTGKYIVDFLEHFKGLRIFFAPGPRLGRISEDLMNRIFALSPILHLNEDEAFAFCGCSDPREAAQVLFEKTKAPLIITQGSKGCLCHDGSEITAIAPVPTDVADTIGAGDSHIGAVIACMQKGDSLVDAAKIANRVSSAVVGVSGAQLDDEAFGRLFPDI